MKKKSIKDKKDLSKYRKAALIRNAGFTKEDHGIDTMFLTFDFEGYTQGLPLYNLSDPTIKKDFVDSICNLFNVSRIDQLVGLKCYGLYNWTEYNSYIEGIEYNGRKFLLTSFFKKYNKDLKSPMEKRKDDLYRRIKDCQMQIFKAKQDLKKIKSDYMDWEKL